MALPPVLGRPIAARIERAVQHGRAHLWSLRFSSNVPAMNYGHAEGRWYYSAGSWAGSGKCMSGPRATPTAWKARTAAPPRGRPGRHGAEPIRSRSRAPSCDGGSGLRLRPSLPVDVEMRRCGPDVPAVTLVVNGEARLTQVDLRACGRLDILRTSSSSVRL